MAKRRAGWATLVMIAVMLGASGACGDAPGAPTPFSSLNYEVRVDAVEGVRTWMVSPWVKVPLPQGAAMIKPLLLVPTQARDGAEKDLLLPPGKEAADEKYMLRQQRLARWDSKVDLGMAIRVAGPCPAVLKEVKGELAAEVAEKLATRELKIEAGKEFELAPGINGRIDGTEPFEMMGRKGLRVKYSYLLPGKQADILPVQVAAVRLFDAKDQVIYIDLGPSGRETVTGDGSKVEGNVAVATDKGKSEPTRIEFTIATGVTVKHLPVVVGDVDLHGINALEMAKGPVKLPEKVEWLAETTTSDGYRVGIAAAKVELHQINGEAERRFITHLADLTFAVRPPEGIPAIKPVMIGFEEVTDAAGKDVLGMNGKLGDDKGLETLARNNRHLPWELSSRRPMTLSNLGVIPQTLARVKGTAVVVAPTTVKHQDLALETGTTAELVKGVSVKIVRVGTWNTMGLSVAYEYDVDLTGAEADAPCYPRGWIMAEWVDDAGQTQPVGSPNTGFGFGFGDDVKATATGRHGKGTAKFMPPAGWKGKIVALRAYGGAGIGLKRVTFEMANVPLMAAPGLSPVE